jgi:predicted nucleic acid-binding protein
MNDNHCFADTNVLIYAVDNESPKKQMAIELLLVKKFHNIAKRYSIKLL